MATLTAADLLDQGADHIEKYGHNKSSWLPKGTRNPFKSSACADGAIRLAAGIVPASGGSLPEVVEDAEAHLAEWLIRCGQPERIREDETTDLPNTIADWNDDAGVDAAEVVEVMRDVANSVRAREGAKELVAEIDAVLRAKSAITTETRIEVPA